MAKFLFYHCRASYREICAKNYPVCCQDSPARLARKNQLLLTQVNEQTLWRLHKENFDLRCLSAEIQEESKRKKNPGPVKKRACWSRYRQLHLLYASNGEREAGRSLGSIFGGHQELPLDDIHAHAPTALFEV
jgi:hypothetical protein